MVHSSSSSHDPFWACLPALNPAQHNTIIIGGGVVGLSVGWLLSEMGARVTLIDAGTPDAHPASLAAAGMLAPGFEGSRSPQERAIEAMGWESLSYWPQFASALEQASGIDIDLRQEGTLGLAATEEQATQLETLYCQMTSEGHTVAFLDQQGVLLREPNLSQHVSAGLFSSSEWQVDPVYLLKALLKAFLQANGTYIGGHRAVQIKPAESNSPGDHKHNVVAAKTDNAAQTQIFTARTVILATGAFLDDLDTDFPLPELIPVKGEAMALLPENHQSPPLLRHVIRNANVYLCPKSDGRIIIGATSITGDNSRTVNPDHLAALYEHARQLVPDIDQMKKGPSWSGLRPITVDGRPLIGPLTDGPAGIIAALGHHRNGILLSPLTARKIAIQLAQEA